MERKSSERSAPYVRVRTIYRIDSVCNVSAVRINVVFQTGIWNLHRLNSAESVENLSVLPILSSIPKFLRMPSSREYIAISEVECFIHFNVEHNIFIRLNFAYGNQSQDSFLQAKLKRPVKISLFCLWSCKTFWLSCFCLMTQQIISFVLDGGKEVRLSWYSVC